MNVLSGFSRLLVLATVCLGGSALADIDGRWHDNPEAGWHANIPAFDPAWMVPTGEWEARLPVEYPVETGLPGFGDWNIGTEPPRRGGDMHCMAIGCEDGGDYRDDIISIGDCDKGPC